MGNARFSQISIRVWTAGAPIARFSQLTARVLSIAQPLARVSQLTVRALSLPESLARFSQLTVRALTRTPIERTEVWDVEISGHWEEPTTRQTVYGAADELGNLITATAQDSAAEALYGVWGGDPISSEAIGTLELAQAVADAAIRERSTPEIELTFLTTKERIRAGQLITVHIPSEGIIRTKFLVRGVTIVQRTEDRTLYRIECGERRPSVDELLNKLEEAFRRRRARRTIAVRCLEFTDGTLEGTRSDSGDVSIQDMATSGGLIAVSAWVFPYRIDQDMTILAKGEPEGGTPKGWTFRQLAVEGFELRIARATTQEVRSSQFGVTVLNARRWHHVYIDRTQCWVDGVLQTGGATIDNPGAGSEIADAGEPIRIGTDFEGALADVRLYSQELGERAIKGLASQPHALNSYVTPVLWWKCDDYGDGDDDLSTLFDYSGNSRAATLNAGEGEGEILAYQIIGA